VKKNPSPKVIGLTNAWIIQSLSYLFFIWRLFEINYFLLNKINFNSPDKLFLFILVFKM